MGDGPLTLPSVGRLNRLTLDIVEYARHRAEHAPIKPGPEIRLVLDVLMVPRAATGFEVTRFWAA